MCKQPQEGKAYYRPLICNGKLSNVGIFLVGTNPATPIFPEELDIDSYIDLLLDYDKFINYYKLKRLAQNKTAFSRTRIGMNSFMRWLANHTEWSIAETEVVPYPTPKLKDLKKEPDYIRQKGMEMFYSLVYEFTPKIIILHGKKTVEWAFSILSEKGLINIVEVNLDESIDEMESRTSLYKFRYPNGKPCIILACRHLMYYGTSGSSYTGFKNNVLAALKEVEE